MTTTNPVGAFRDEMRGRGPAYDPGDLELVGDGHLRRFRASDDRAGKRSGWYVLHVNGHHPAGAFGSWRTGERFNWKADTGKPFLTDLEISEARHDEAARKKSEKIARDRAKDRAGKLWQAAQDPADPGHAYLVRKRIGANGVRQLGQVLAVPLPLNGELVGLQFIRGDGSKRYMRGSAPAGAYYTLGEIDDKVIVAEGFATGAAIYESTGVATAVAFSAGNLLAVATSLHKQHPNATIIVAADDDAETKGNPGVNYATTAARSVDGAIALPTFEGKRATVAFDFSDLLVQHGAEAVKAAIETAAKVAPTIAGGTNDEECIIDELAGHSELEYERRREAAQKKLGIRASALDKLVGDARNERAQRKRLANLFPEVKPSDQPVDGERLLADLARIFDRFIILPKHASSMLALWTVFTYAHDYFEHSPLLLLRSAMKRCGKSTLLALITEVAHRALAASNLTPAVVYRVVEESSPTLLIDELDSFLDASEELRGILNSGHKRAAARVFRVEEIAGKRETVGYSTWAPKVLAMIGRPPATLLDRAISVKMQRKLRGDKIEKRRGAVLEVDAIRSKCLRWAIDNETVLREAKPIVPEALNDRQADSWTPLLAIADRASPAWADIAREAALALCGADVLDQEELAEELLRDIRTIFDTRVIERVSDPDRICSEDLVRALLDLDDRPWNEANRGRPITQNWLGRRLGPFGIRSGSIRLADGRTPKGYYCIKFQETWDRYLSDS